MCGAGASITSTIAALARGSANENVLPEATTRSSAPGAQSRPGGPTSRRSARRWSPSGPWPRGAELSPTRSTARGRGRPRDRAGIVVAEHNANKGVGHRHRVGPQRGGRGRNRDRGMDPGPMRREQQPGEERPYLGDDPVVLDDGRVPQAGARVVEVAPGRTGSGALEEVVGAPERRGEGVADPGLPAAREGVGLADAKSPGSRRRRRSRPVGAGWRRAAGRATAAGRWSAGGHRSLGSSAG